MIGKPQVEGEVRGVKHLGAKIECSEQSCGGGHELDMVGMGTQLACFGLFSRHLYALGPPEFMHTSCVREFLTHDFLLHVPVLSASLPRRRKGVMWQIDGKFNVKM